MKTTTRFSCLAALVLLASSCGGGGERPRTKTFLTVQKPVKISGFSHPMLVRNPQGVLFMAAFIHSAFPSATEAREAIAVFESRDDGATWQEISRIPSFVTYGVWGSDLAIDGRGSLYATWSAGVHEMQPRRTYKAIMFARSDDHGRTWTEPVRVSDQTSGQRHWPAIAVSGDDAYIAWLDGRASGPVGTGLSVSDDVYIARSTDRGARWSANTCLETGLANKASTSSSPSLCVGADGSVYCAYFSMRKQKGAAAGFWLATSTDRGKTFSARHHGGGVISDVTLAEADGRLFLAAVHITGFRGIPATSQELRLRVSDDGGSTWSRAVRIDDDGGHSAKHNVRIVSAGAGRLVAAFDDERGGVYLAASTDNGETWGINVNAAARSRIGNTPLDLAADPATGAVYLTTGDIRKGAGDAIRYVKGTIVP